MSPIMELLPVRSAQGDYAVGFPSSLSDAIAPFLVKPPTVAVVDARVAQLHQEPLHTLLDVIPHLLMDAHEDTKTLTGVERCLRFFQAQGCTRGSEVLAIGGGIVQDLCTFSAHIYYRGIRWRFLPTTLLSMSDSCIGAKCGINLGAFKNQLGAFHSPTSVVICTSFLSTLEDRDIASGYGEILKLALTGDTDHFRQLELAVEEGGLRNGHLPSLLRAALDTKRAVIEADEYETGLRQILNYGHTFGHALEAATDHAVPHGLAVAWGMDVINHIAHRRGLLAAPEHHRIRTFIHTHLAIPHPRPIAADALLTAVRRDKKAAQGWVTLAILREPGRLERIPTAIDHQLEEDLQDYLDHHDVFRRP